MNGTAARFFRLGVSLAGLVALGWVLTGQAAKPARHGIPLPTDWSHRHLIFSSAASADRRAEISKDPRYWQQQYRRLQPLQLATAEQNSDLQLRVHGGRGPRFERDWAMSLGGSGGVGAGNYPAKYSYDSSTANCGNATTPDYVVYSTGQGGVPLATASIVAFDNLYSGCTGTVPSTYWAYNTSSLFPATVETSPIPSINGTQVAFVQSDTFGDGTVVILSWAAGSGTLGSPETPTLETPASSYPGCAAPCMLQLSLSDPTGPLGTSVPSNDVTSSIYYDFSNDIAWVGDASGYLHKFQHFFKGTSANPPAEVTTSPWPLSVSTGWLSSPVYDRISGNVFVGDESGYLYAVNATSGAITKSGQLDHSGVGIVEGPVVDTSNQLVYVFASGDGTTSCAGSVACTAVYQLPTNFGATTTGTKVTIGNSSASPNTAYIGGFDSAYYDSANATGNLYACGNTGGAATLYQVPIAAGHLPTTPAAGKAVGTSSLSTATAACSSVTDVPNPNTSAGPSERLFVSVADNGRSTGCAAGGCVINFVNAPWKASTGYAVGQQVLDSNGNIEIVIIAGASGTTAPSWATDAGKTTPLDGTPNPVTWLNQGLLTADTIDQWVSGHNYLTATDRVLDSNNNVEIPTTAGTSGGSTPAWNPTLNGTTPDGGVTWTNAGPVSTFALPASGGTSGIISDNTVGTGTLAGASQVYFTTLGTQTCATSGGTGVCAVQASQTALQ